VVAQHVESRGKIVMGPMQQDLNNRTTISLADGAHPEGEREARFPLPELTAQVDG